MYNRADGGMAKDVYEGIALDQWKGAAIAWAFMTHHQVPQPVILRVLTEPNRRRISQWEARVKELGMRNSIGLIHLWRTDK